MENNTILPNVWAHFADAKLSATWHMINEVSHYGNAVRGVIVASLQDTTYDMRHFEDITESDVSDMTTYIIFLHDGRIGCISRALYTNNESRSKRQPGQFIYQYSRFFSGWRPGPSIDELNAIVSDLSKGFHTAKY